MREITIIMADGARYSGVERPNGEIWSPLGRDLDRSQVREIRPANVDGYDNDLDVLAWRDRVRRVGAHVRATSAPRPRYGQAGRWS